MARGPEEPDLSRYVVLAVEGPKVTPETVDAPSMLELAAAFFQLVVANAADRGASISLKGLTVVNKCAALCVVPDEFDVARECADAALRQIGGEDPPHGLVELTDRGREAVRDLPPGHQAKVLLGPWVRTIPRTPEAAPHQLESMLSIQAKPIRVGGRRPTARFASEMEDDFTLSLTAAQARSLGAKLYEPVVIEARVRRDADGAIVGGELTSVEDVAVGDPRPAWREWARKLEPPVQRRARRRKREH